MQNPLTDDLKKAIDELLAHIAKMNAEYIENDEVNRGDLGQLFELANGLLFEFGAALEKGAKQK